MLSSPAAGNDGHPSVPKPAVALGIGAPQERRDRHGLSLRSR